MNDEIRHEKPVEVNLQLTHRKHRRSHSWSSGRDSVTAAGWQRLILRHT